MPKRAKELTPGQIKEKAKRPGFHSVGGVAGLHLAVKGPRSASWVLRAKVGDRRRDIGLGAYPDVTLAQARENARARRQEIADGIDPVEAKKARREALRAANGRKPTFRESAVKCHSTKKKEFRNAKHRQDWIVSLETYAYPVIGKLPVDEIDRNKVVEVLEPIWDDKTETATRVRQRMETVFSWATAKGYRVGENPARWKGGLEFILPKPSKVRKVTHHRALSWKKVPSFMAKLKKREGVSARALEFAILTVARSGEIRLATWEEIDVKAKLWTVPGGRMKGGKAHRVPLSGAAVKILKSLPRDEGCPYVFPAPRGGALSDMSISAVCRRMKVDAVPHGFRSSFKDWARNHNTYSDEVSELALAHVNSDATRAAYARDELLEMRANLMRDWAEFCYSGRS